MASTGNVYPGTGENNAGIGATAWTSPGSVTADDATDATCNAAASSQYLVARNYGFSVPAAATIVGITVRVEASEHSADTESLNARLQDDSGTLVGSSKAATISGTGKSVYTYGGTADLWGATLTPAIVNDADFGVRLWFTTAHDVRIDYVTLAVEYVLPDAPEDVVADDYPDEHLPTQADTYQQSEHSPPPADNDIPESFVDAGQADDDLPRQADTYQQSEHSPPPADNDIPWSDAAEADDDASDLPHDGSTWFALPDAAPADNDIPQSFADVDVLDDDPPRQADTYQQTEGAPPANDPRPFDDPPADAEWDEDADDLDILDDWDSTLPDEEFGEMAQWVDDDELPHDGSTWFVQDEPAPADNNIPESLAADVEDEYEEHVGSAEIVPPPQNDIPESFADEAADEYEHHEGDPDFEQATVPPQHDIAQSFAAEDADEYVEHVGEADVLAVAALPGGTAPSAADWRAPIERRLLVLVERRVWRVPAERRMVQN